MTDTPSEVTVICHTRGCSNQGMPLTLPGPDPEVPSTYMCGACGQPINDVRSGAEPKADA